MTDGFWLSRLYPKVCTRFLLPFCMCCDSRRHRFLFLCVIRIFFYFVFFFLVLFLLFLLVFDDDNAARMWRVWRDMLNEYILQYHSTSAVETCFFFIHSLKYYICAFWPIHPPTRVATQECKVCAPRIGIVSVESDGANACYVCFIYHSAACYDMPIASNCDTRLGGLFFWGGDSGGESFGALPFMYHRM